MDSIFGHAQKYPKMSREQFQGWLDQCPQPCHQRRGQFRIFRHDPVGNRFDFGNGRSSKSWLNKEMKLFFKLIHFLEVLGFYGRHMLFFLGAFFKSSTQGKWKSVKNNFISLFSHDLKTPIAKNQKRLPTGS